MNRPIFVVEGDTRLRRGIRDFIERHDYPVCTFPTDSRVIPEAEETRPALFLIDTVLSGEGGLNLCWRIRHHPCFNDTPVILLSPTASEDDLVYALEIGADDYIRQPFSLPEMMTRIRTVIRRFERTSSPASIQAGPIELNRFSMTLSVEGKDVPINLTEFRLLDYFMRNPSRVFTRNQILDAVWGAEKFVAPSSVTVQVGRLRIKTEPDPAWPRYLQTVRGRGYRFEPEGSRRVHIPKPAWNVLSQAQPPRPFHHEPTGCLELDSGAA